uniref:C-type lectin domain-containing protein n=1 Tax=Acrobeloides nanus TaxID=290746 RepID=A0A914EGV3_9BILA
MRSDAQGKWYATDCNQKYSYVCKLDMTLPGTCTTCDEGWIFSTLTGKCYQYFNMSGISFTGAQASCQTFNADLVSVHSHLENTFISDLNNLVVPNWGIVTGLQCMNGTCSWIDGTPFDYKVFFDPYATPNDPNIQWCTYIVSDGKTHGFGPHECLQQSQTWKTFTCEALVWPFLCQKNPTISTSQKSMKLKNLQKVSKRNRSGASF